MSKKLLKTEKVSNRKEIADQIHKIADKIENGQVHLTAGAESVELDIPETAEFEIQVEEENDGELSLEMEVEWNPNQEGTSEDLEIK